MWRELEELALLSISADRGQSDEGILQNKNF